jgi:hypothetical protein
MEMVRVTSKMGVDTSKIRHLEASATLEEFLLCEIGFGLPSTKANPRVLMSPLTNGPQLF